MFTYEQIEKANSTISTTNIKGKEYAEVNQRIKAFRQVCPNGAIITEMVSNEAGVCIFKATIRDEMGNVLGTGMAYEKESKNGVNSTSYIENCETSAVGRALGMCGFGIDISVASAEEVENAINQQEAGKGTQPQKEPANVTPLVDYRQKLISMLQEREIDMTEYAREKKINSKTSQSVFKKLCEELEERG